MKHNSHLSGFPFVVEPEPFNKKSPKNMLQYSLGATLYMPGTKYVVDKIRNNTLTDLTSMVMCLEDAIDEKDLEAAEQNVLEHLDALADHLAKDSAVLDQLPLLFVRVRNREQFRRFSQHLTEKRVQSLTGFVFPKFDSTNAAEYLENLSILNQHLNSRLYCMPILEGASIAFSETRLSELLRIKVLIQPYSDTVLNIRVGGTDFSAFFGVRREINSSIYDILPVQGCLSDIINIFGRFSDGYTLSAPVWEYFLAYNDEDLVELLDDSIHTSLLRRNTIINDAVDGLLREVILDKANGFVGKTVIHPSHLRFVNAMQAVTREEYEDATQILGMTGGVAKSKQHNKMNEVGPHGNWAKRVVSRARAYGVVESESSYLKLMLAR
jgi:citrate lyase beta subunit